MAKKITQPSINSFRSSESIYQSSIGKYFSSSLILNTYKSCRDHAVAENIFELLQLAKVKRVIYVYKAEERSDIFEYIEIFLFKIPRQFQWLGSYSRV